MATRVLRIGVLGCADIAWRRMLPAMAADPGAEVTAFASGDPERARRFAARFGGEPLTDRDELLNRPDVDAVYIPLPTGLHARWVDRALRSGLHVLAEKPLAATARQTADLVALAETNGLALVENMMFLRHSQHATVRRLLDEGAIGTVRQLNAEFAFPAPSAAGADPVLSADAGGALADIGVYPVRTALLHLGAELEVLGAHLRYGNGSPADIGGAALLRAPDGTTAHLTFGMQHAYRSRYSLWGDRGRLSVHWAYTPPPTHQPVIRLERQNHAEEFTLPADDQFATVVRDFVARALDGTPTPLDGRESITQASVIDRIRVAAAAVRH